MKVKIAVAQPLAFRGNESVKNLEQAKQLIEEAARQGAKIICFPEGYPGPYSFLPDYSPVEAICKKCAESKIYCLSGGLEKSEDGKAFYVVQHMIGPDGKILGTYRRTTPMGPYVYHDIPDWGFDYVAGEELQVYDTPFAKIGVLMCSEVYTPELARVLVLKGAEIIFYPSGALINELMPTWKVMVRARAIENLAYTAACQNIYGVEDGVGIIAGPEGIIAENTNPCLMIADLDMDRMHWLRGQDEVVEMPKQYRVVPGTLKWRRPDIYKKNCKDW